MRDAFGTYSGFLNSYTEIDQGSTGYNVPVHITCAVTRLATDGVTETEVSDIGQVTTKVGGTVYCDSGDRVHVAPSELACTSWPDIYNHTHLDDGIFAQDDYFSGAGWCL